MPTYWQEEYLIKRLDYDIRWYQMGKIQIVASEGDMRREAIDIWATLVREVVESISKEEPMFIIVDLSGKKQGFTPYSSTVTRNLLNYVVETRSELSYIGLVLANNLIMQIINVFMQQILTRTRYPRNSFTEPEAALKWMHEQIERDEQKRQT